MPQQDHRVTLQPAFVLHGRDYRDSSRLLDVFSRDYGRVTLVAKGVRSARSRLQGILHPFTPLLVSWTGRGEVQTLTAAEAVKTSIALSRRQLMSGYYMNELIQRLVTLHDPHPELYAIYEQALLDFLQLSDEQVLRRFEKHLLTAIGYALNLQTESLTGEAVMADANYYYDIEAGAVKVTSAEQAEGQFVVRGQTLLDLQHEQFSSDESRLQAKQLMRMIMGYFLGDKPLKTRSLHWYKTL